MSQRKARSNERVFVVEGPTVVAEAFASGLDVHELFVGLEANEDASAFMDLIASARGDDIPVRFCKAHALGSSLSTVTPQPVAAVVSQPVYETSEFDPDRPVLVAVDVRDPGNVGTLVRTAEASGCAGMIVAGTSTDVWSPKVVRASAGAVLRLKVVVDKAVSEVLEELTNQGRVVAGSVASGHATPYEQVDLRTAAIVVGNEARGLDSSVIEACTEQITIELDGPTESLNAATAGAVLCFEALRQRR